MRRLWNAAFAQAHPNETPSLAATGLGQKSGQWRQIGGTYFSLSVFERLQTHSMLPAWTIGE